MDRFKGIEELLRMVADLLDKPSQYRMALSSRDLWAVARKPLWETIPDCRVLMALVLPWTVSDRHPLSSHLILSSPQRNGPGTLGVNITSETFNRFKLYSPFVKDITTPLDNAEITFLISISSHLPTSHPLPILRHLRVRPETIGPSLLISLLPERPITIELFLFENIRASQFVRTLFSALDTRRRTALKKLILGSADLEMIVAEEIARFFSTDPPLEEVVLDARFAEGVGETLLSGAASLPKLRHVEIATPHRDSSSGTPTAITSGFNSLTSMASSGSPRLFTKTLPSIRSKYLQTLALSSFEAGDMDEALEAVGKLKTLQNLEIAVGEVEISNRGISALVGCWQMRRFTGDLRLENSQIEFLAAAWEFLQVLSLDDKYNRRPKVTLQGLSCLAERCRDLQELDIAVVVGEEGVGLVRHPATALKRLELRISGLSEHNIREVARFINEMWPSGRPRRHSDEDPLWSVVEDMRRAGTVE